MSENLLNALLELFALIAKKGTVTDDERNTINNFLQEQLSSDAAQKHLNTFDRFAQQHVADEKKEIDKICHKINQEFTQQQKVVLCLQLVELIVADGEIAEEEVAILKAVSSAIRIPTTIIEHIKDFLLTIDVKAFDAEQVLLEVSSDVEVGEHPHVLNDHLRGYLAFLKLPELEMYFVKYKGTAQLNINGIPLRSGKTVIFPTGSTIKGDKVQVFYSDIVNRFKQGDDTPTISFEAKDISFTFPNGHKGLHKVNIAEETGKLIGLMGASGSGKSTLLNVLNGNEKPTEGAVRINGIDIHYEPKRIEGTIGYVPQDDLLMEELTVFQNLYYAAKLCFSNKSEEEITLLVNATLAALGLSETKNLKVGSPLEKTISGGQRKRLNIGLELLREPSVLFVDEPTSGLSSRDSENIMDLLKELSLKGKMVFVVIHQPSSDIFRMFDKLVILDVGGYQIYYGNPVEAVVYFKSQINTIDKEQGACQECGNVNPEQIFNIIETKVVNEYGRLTDERKIAPARWSSRFEEHITIPAPSHAEQLPEPGLHIPSWLQQIRIFFNRDLRSKLANRQYLLINLLEAPLLAGILAYIIRYYPTTHAEKGYLFVDNLNIPAFFFISIIVALFMGLTVSAEEIIKDRKILKRESFLHLSRSSYLLSKVGILFAFSAVQTLTYVLIGDFILEVDGLNMVYWMILFTTACFANMLGLNVSSAFNSAITIYILIPILLIPQLILSGVVVKFDNLNPQITTVDKVPMVGEMMTSRWAFEAAMVAQYQYNEYNQPFYQLDKQMAQSEYRTVYYLPELESRLEFLINNLADKKSEEFQANLTVLRNEIGKELEEIGEQYFTHYDALTTDAFDRETAEATQAFLATLKRLYNNLYNEASTKKEKAIYILTSNEEKKEQFNYLRTHYFNQAVSDLVKNANDANRIVEEDGELVQKIYPVYMDPQPAHMLDFRAQFYAGSKYFGGYIFETLYFNLLVIWLMTFILYGTLYYDVFRKLLKNA